MVIQPPSKTSLNSVWNILIIDDDEDDFIITRDMLKKAKGRKFHTERAATYQAGQEALLSKHYDAVLVDYDLGVHSGIELIRETSQREYPAPLILFTGRGTYEVDVEAMQAGATLYLTKGEVNPLLLERAIRYAIERKFIETQLRGSNERLADELTERQRVETELRKNSEALRESEEKYRTLFENSPDAIFFTHPDGSVQAANPAACAMFGWSEPEFCRIGRSGVLAADDPRLATALDEHQRTGQIKTQELTGIRKNGERFPIEISSIIVSSEPLRSFVIMRDISERKRVEDALRAAHERAAWLARFPDENPNPVARVAADGRVLYKNMAATNQPGWLCEDDQRLPDAIQTLIRQAMEQGQEIEQEIELCDQVYSLSLMPFPSDNYVNLYGRDVTKRRQAEEALRTSEAHLRASEERITDFLESMHEYFAALDHDYRYVYINQRFAEILGRNANELIGKNIWEEFPNYLGTIAEQNYRKVMEERVPIQFQLAGVYSNNWYDISIYPTKEGISIFASDRTEAHIAEMAIRESEERFRQLADAMPHLVWTARPDGTIDYFNQRHQEYEGLIQIDGDHWECVNGIHPDDLQLLVDTWSEVVQKGNEFQLEFRMRMLDGSYRWHLARAIPIKDNAGRVTRWFGSDTDIEAQKQTEERLLRSNQELEQFAFVASHDLQEPLRKIKLFGNSIQQTLLGKLDEETQVNFQRMMNASERMQAMIEDLLELSRVNTQGRPFVEVDLSAVAAEVVYDIESLMLRTKGKVIVEPLPIIEGDPIQIHQVLQNLIGNALKFHQPGIPPIVKVSSTVTKSPTGKGQGVVIQVADNGIGFEDQQFEKILQPFQRLHGRTEFEGNGIGLAIVKKIIERHHGRISAHSRPGEGATFIITLPAKNQVDGR